MSHVVLSHSRRLSGQHVFEIEKPWATALPGRTFDGAWADGHVVARPLRLSRKEPFRALRSLWFEGALIVHREVAAALPTELRVGARPIAFSSKAKGPATEDEYVLLPVDAYAPLDREKCTFELAGEGEGGPFRGHAYKLTTLAFAHPEALPPLFRLVENPRIVIARADIAKRLEELTKRDIVGEPSSPLTFEPEDSQTEPLDLAEKDARAAHEAFWKVLAGTGTKGERAAALRHPMLAVAVALSVDRAPSNETRTAACAHPFWAVMYALHVDRGARDDTRKAAQASVDGEVFYTSSLDLVPADGLAKRMLAKEGWWDGPSIEGFMSSLAETQAQYRGGTGGAGPRKLATRDYPVAKSVSRYLETKSKLLAPLSEELRSDVEAMTKHGHALLSLAPTAHPSEVIDAVHVAIDEIQAGERKVPGGKAGMQLRLGLACALADGLHRGLGWQWSSVEGTVAVVSPGKTHAVVPLTPIARLAKKGARGNTVALLFNMIVAGNLAPKQKNGVVFVS